MIGITRLMKEMPIGYENACFEKNAIKRKREIKSADDLMLLIMFHLLNGCSLMEISEISKLAKLGNVSDVAFMKKFKNCNEWFKWILSELVTGGMALYQKPQWLEKYRVIAVDASDVSEKGKSGRVFRLHFALDLFKMEALRYTITTNKTGESLKNFTLETSDLIIGDRAYGTLVGIEHCLKNGANFNKNALFIT